MALPIRPGLTVPLPGPLHGHRDKLSELVDLRLRGEGTVGQLTRSLEDYAKYYRTRGQVWERLSLLKAWPVAGSMTVGKAFIKMVQPFVLAPASKRLDVEQGLAVVNEVRSV
ncbi:MAG: hypothetical protein ABL955_11465, partial [Elusimicrobiota bacterium]